MEKKYQIFISSTYKDLIEARSKVRDAILSMMHFPVGMEMFNAADEEQWEIIQETIDSSDYYVLILGQRYGSVIESGSDAGISYTEKEFRYAREKKIPILVFIIDDDVAIKPEFMEKDPESIKKLADFKTEAKKGRTVQWWTNIDELAREVSESLHKQMDRKKRPGWIRGDAFDIEASHAEILSLNRKIRELEQENAELKSQIVKRVPELVAAVVLDQQDDEEVDGKGLKTHGKLLIDSSDNAIKIQLYANIVITKFMKNISCAVRVSSSLLSRTCAQARIPYVGMPSCANIAKYEITDVAKETFPVPSGNKMRETYGKVMRGNMNCDIVRMAFMTKFNLSDFFIFYSLLPRSNITF